MRERKNEDDGNTDRSEEYKSNTHGAIKVLSPKLIGKFGSSHLP